jgi:hypothetical protein
VDDGDLLHIGGRARKGERKEMPPELQAQMDEMKKLSVGEPEFLDLKDPGSTRPANTPRTSAPPSALLTGRCLRRHEHRSVLTHLKDVVASRPVTLATTSRQAPPTALLR